MTHVGSGGAVDVVADERVLTVTLTNPPDNRLTPSIVEGLDAAVSRFESADLDVLVITGSRRSFSKGFDVDTIKSYREPSELRTVLGSCNAVFTRLARCPKLTVAAINGACMGGGLELALACHLRVCSEKARLGLPEVWLNLIPGLGGFYRLAALLGATKALELTALGDLITAEEALRLNLVTRVFPGDGFPERVTSFLGAVLAADQRVIRELIQLAACSRTLGEESNLARAADTFVELVGCLQKR